MILIERTAKPWPNQWTLLEKWARHGNYSVSVDASAERPVVKVWACHGHLNTSLTVNVDMAEVLAEMLTQAARVIRERETAKAEVAEVTA